MHHTVPFESHLKNDPPPHPGEDQTSKRAKLDETPLLSDSMEADSLPEPTTEFVPETPLTQPEHDVQMGEDPVTANPKVPSFKDKLLNSDSKCPEEEEADFLLNQEDVSIGLNGSIPTIDFATHVLNALNQKMGLAVVVKLLGRNIGHRHLCLRLQSLWKPTGQMKTIDLNDGCFIVRFKDDLDYQNAFLDGPWVIFGHYLSVQPWSPAFKPHEHVINQVVGWIRLPRLPARYYHKSIIRSIGSVFGEVIRVDYNTDSGDRGKFARLAIIIDLTKPLTSKIQVDGELIFVEYEGLPSICFNCGRYGHLQESCPANMVVTVDGSPEAPCNPVQNGGALVSAVASRDMEDYGEWMQVQRRQSRFPDRGGRRAVTFEGSGVATTLRYDVLIEEEPVKEVGQGLHGQESVKSLPNIGISFQKKKGKEAKDAFRTDSGLGQQQPSRQAPNQDCIFNLPSYSTRTATTTLDGNCNFAILINDPRLSQRRQDANGLLNGPALPPSTGNDPLAKPRGFKLASGLAIHNLGAKPNLNSAGPSVRYMKEVARGIHDTPDATDERMSSEGVALNSNLQN